MAAPTTNEIHTIKQRSISGALSYIVRTLVLQGIGFLSLIILSRLFAPEDFGIYGFVVMIIGLLTFFSDVGLAAALVQQKEEPSAEEYQTAFTIQQLLGWGIVAASGILIVLKVISNKTGPAGDWILLSLALSFPLTTLKTIPSVILERKLEFSKLVLPQIVEQLAFHSILIVLALKGVGVVSYAYAIAIRTLLGVVLMNMIQRWQIGIKISRPALKTLFSYGVKFQLNDLLARIKDQLFYIVVGIVLPLREFGYIQWSKNWSMYPYTLTVQNVMAITFPTFSRLQHKPDILAKGLELSLFFITLFIFPIIIGMAVFIHPLLSVFADQYGKWLPAAMSFALFSLSIGWSAVSTPLTNLLNAIGKINQTLKLMIGWTVLTWVLTPPLIWFFGYNGVALAALLISFTSIAAVVMVKRELPFKLLPNVGPQLLAASVMGIVGLVGRSYWSTSLPHLVSGALLTAGVYFLLVVLLTRERLMTNVQYIVRRRK